MGTLNQNAWFKGFCLFLPCIFCVPLGDKSKFVSILSQLIFWPPKFAIFPCHAHFPISFAVFGKRKPAVHGFLRIFRRIFAFSWHHPAAVHSEGVPRGPPGPEANLVLKNPNLWPQNNLSAFPAFLQRFFWGPRPISPLSYLLFRFAGKVLCFSIGCTATVQLFFHHTADIPPPPTHVARMTATPGTRDT